jgi:2-polyprenyl-3-methyl-5-hydroxy-6-metoxy-1,4-benzoquinol methylase
MKDQKNPIYYSGYRKEMLSFIPSGSKNILEVGCAEGNFLTQLSMDGTELWGVEPDAASAAIASQKLHKVLNFPLEEAINKLPDQYFDAIIFNDVLEHMHYPEENLRLIRSKLKSSGRIIASIPNFRYVRSLFQVVVKRNWNYTDHGILDYTHFRFFTRKSIIRMFNESGYGTETIKGINPTRSIKFHLLVYLFCLLTFSNQLDMLYMQFAVVAGIRTPSEKG